jgi:hypothetical protein
MTILFGLFLDNLQPGRHARGCVFQHVAMQQPVTGIVGNKGYFGNFAPLNKKSVAQWTSGAVFLDLSEMEAVQMHGMREQASDTIECPEHVVRNQFPHIPH